MKVAAGDAIPPFRIERVTPKRMKTVAAIFREPFPVHWDREATRAIAFEGMLLNQSPINLGYVINMLIAWAGPTCVKRIQTEFPQPVFDGNSACAGGRVVALSTEAGETIAECEMWLDRQDGVRSVAARAWVLCRAPAGSSAVGITTRPFASMTSGASRSRPTLPPIPRQIR